MTLTSKVYGTCCNLKTIGGNWKSVKTGLKTAKYLAEDVISACGHQKSPAVVKAVILPQQHPLYKAGIAEIAMMEHSKLRKEVSLIDKCGEIVSQGFTRSKKGLSNLKNDVKLMLEGKLKYTENAIIRKD